MDWSRIIQEIQDVGLTQKEIAQFCNCSQGTISQIKNRYSKKNTISYEIGMKLKKLYDEKVKK